MNRFYILLVLYFISACTPQSENEEFYSIDEFDQVEKIDTHVHIRAERDAFVEQARKDNFKLVTIVVDHSEGMQDVREQFRYGMLQTNEHPDEIVCVTAFSSI